MADNGKEVNGLARLEDIPQELAVLENVAAQLAEWQDIDSLVKLVNQAESVRAYLRKEGYGIEIQNRAALVVIAARRRLGELLKDLPERRGQHEKSHDATFLPVPTYADFGIQKDRANRCLLIKSIPLDKYQDYIARTIEADRELTSAGLLKLARQLKAQAPIDRSPDEFVGQGIVGSLQELIDGGKLFATICADPPWRYGNQATRASTNNHYRTMTIDEICAEPVAQVAEDNAHLHLWTTNAFLRDAFTVMEAWGFTYKSCYVWVKPQMGIGNYWRVSHEFLLFGVRGRCPFLARDAMSWGAFDRTGHSSKPDEIRQIIERVSPGPYLEMYGREALTSSWTVYGNQVQGGLL